MDWQGNQFSTQVFQKRAQHCHFAFVSVQSVSSLSVGNLAIKVPPEIPPADFRSNISPNQAMLLTFTHLEKPPKPRKGRNKQSHGACQQREEAQHTSHYYTSRELMPETKISTQSRLHGDFHLQVIALDHNWLTRCLLLRPLSDHNDSVHTRLAEGQFVEKAK